MSTDPSPLQTPYNHTAWSNDAYITPTPGLSYSLLDDDSPTITSPMTPLSNLLLPPDHISLSGRNATGPSMDSGSRAYKQLVDKCHHLEHELAKEKRENENLRSTNQKLIDTQSVLMSMVSKHATKRRHEVDDYDSSSPPASDATKEIPKPHAYSRSQFPLVKYWEKQVWTSQENRIKNASQVDSKGGARGSKRLSGGENVMMQFVELEDGTPVSGHEASAMREHARAIFGDLDEIGKAPAKWGNASGDARKRYIQEMEGRWEVLKYCEFNWKATKIATLCYPHWYKNHSNHAQKTKASEEHPSKKPRTMTSDSEDRDSPDPEVHDSPCGSPIEGVDPGPSRHRVQTDDETTLPRTVSRPRARPLRDPLADAFDQPNALRFPIMDVVPTSSGARQTATQATSSTLVSCGVAPHAPPALTPAHITADIASGMAPTVTTREHCNAPAQIARYLASGTAPHVPPPDLSSIPAYITGDLTSGAAAHATPPGHSPTPGPIDATLDLTGNTGPRSPTDGAAEARRNFELDYRKRKYNIKKKMTPGDGCRPRDLYSVDWCKQHPEGTIGEFNRDYDSLDPKLLASYELQEKIRLAKHSTNPLPPRRAPRQKK